MLYESEKIPKENECKAFFDKELTIIESETDCKVKTYRYRMFGKSDKITAADSSVIAQFIEFAKQSVIKERDIRLVLHLTRTRAADDKNDIFWNRIIEKLRQDAASINATIVLHNGREYDMPCLNREQWLKFAEAEPPRNQGTDNLKIYEHIQINVNLDDDAQIDGLRYYFPLRHHRCDVSLAITASGCRPQVKKWLRFIDKDIYEISIASNEVTAKSDARKNGKKDSYIMPLLAITDMEQPEEYAAKINESRRYKNVFPGDSFADMIYNYMISATQWHDSESTSCSLPSQHMVNAKSYAEILRQIIENAIKHSQGQIAFVGMRLYNASVNGQMDDTQFITRKNLRNKYNATARGNGILDNPAYEHFFEFYVIDDATNDTQRGVGMLDTVKTEDFVPEKAPKSLEALFTLTEDCYAEEKRLDYYIEHYGLRLVKHYVDKMAGIMDICTPSNTSEQNPCQCCYGVDAEHDNALTLRQHVYFTEFAILLPLPYSSIDKASAGASFEYDVNATNRNTCVLKDYSFEEAECDVSRNGTDLLQYIGNPSNDKAAEFYLVPIKLPDSIKQIECFAKTLFYVLYAIYGEENVPCEESLLRTAREFGKKNMCFALTFDGDAKKSQENIEAFVRLFSVFHLKVAESKRTDYMQNVQVACCSYNRARDKKKPAAEYKEINFVIAGSDFRTAYQTASDFLYYNADSQHNFLPLLHSLSAADKDAAQPCILFPFDLFLTESFHIN